MKIAPNVGLSLRHTPSSLLKLGCGLHSKSHFQSGRAHDLGACPAKLDQAPRRSKASTGVYDSKRDATALAVRVARHVVFTASQCSRDTCQIQGLRIKE